MMKNDKCQKLYQIEIMKEKFPNCGFEKICLVIGMGMVFLQLWLS
ncbi:hypothetical protein HanXRQr2_Chr09g0405621 [Helianthus annuus]|uniref:Uncharacterized protein n=1 Tax=Helianthus annuus TaxID=4232 RepID=A0A9K3I8Z0_HELAN|nr:hypothetical protein HanXRQr2_Chr09g0405621 [Helianthus annuus]